jgi:hypothetical protein
MTVFTHHIYEFRKGLRNLVLHTMSGEEREWACRTLERKGIAYQMYPLDSGAVNVFFGATDCVEVVRAIGKPSLSDYTPEEDFILGTMLGYDRLLQCRRYLRFLKGAQAFTPPRGRDDIAAAISEDEPVVDDERLSPRSPTKADSHEQPSRIAAAHACSHGGDEPCTGCLTGNPCAACRERMAAAAAALEKTA